MDSEVKTISLKPGDAVEAAAMSYMAEMSSKGATITVAQADDEFEVTLKEKVNG